MKYGKYVKVFFAVGIAFWLAMAVLLFILLGSLRTALGAALVPGAIFGAIGAGLFYWADRKRIEEGHEIDDFEFKAVSAKCQINVRKPVAEAMVLCKSSLRLLPKVAIEEESADRLKAKIGMSWRSIGEILEIAAFRDGDDATRIGIRSRPVVAWTPIDFGKNAENVDRKSTRLNSSHIQKSRMPSSA